MAGPRNLFDYLISGCKQHRRHIKAQDPGSLEVDCEIEFRGLHDWEVGWLFTLQNPGDVYAALAIGIVMLGP
jgi:hypothetical protein